MELYTMSQVPEPMIFRKKNIKTMIIVPFVINGDIVSFSKKLEQNQIKFQPDGERIQIWQKSKFLGKEDKQLEDIYKYFSNHILKNWFQQQNDMAYVCNHYTIPTNVIQYIFPNNNRFYAINKEVSSKKSDDFDLFQNYLYQMKSIGLTIFPFGVACLYLEVEHLLFLDKKTSAKVSHSISMLKRVNSQMLLHSFYDGEKYIPKTADLEEVYPHSFLLQERKSLPKNSTKKENCHFISIQNFVYAILFSSEEENRDVTLFSDYATHIYSYIPISATEENYDQHIDQWLYYLSCGALLPKTEEEMFPNLIGIDHKHYDLATYHKRKGLIMRFCREGILSIGNLQVADGYIGTKWPELFFSKYLLLYLQVLAEHYMIEAFQHKGQILYRQDWYNNTHESHILDDLESLARDMSRFQMNFMMINCGIGTDTNIFFESARNILSLDHRIKTHNDILIQVVHLIATIKEREVLSVQNSFLEALESLGKVQTSSLEALTSLGKVQTSSLSELKDLGNVQNISLDALKDLGKVQNSSLDALTRLNAVQQDLNASQSTREEQERIRAVFAGFLGVLAIPFTVISGLYGINSQEFNVTIEKVIIMSSIMMVVFLLIFLVIKFFFNKEK